MTTGIIRQYLALPAIAVFGINALASAETRPAPGVLERSEVRAAIAAPDVRQAEARLAQAIRPEHRDWALARAIIDQPGRGTAAREYLLHALLIRARNLEPDAASRAFVTRFADHQSKTFVRHEEGPLPVAVYPVAQTARGTLRYWQRQDLRREAAVALAAGDMSALRRLRQPGDDAYAATLAALEEADAVAMSQAADWLDANAGPEAFRDLRFVTAIGLRDTRRVSELLETDSGAAVRRLGDLSEHFDAATALDLLGDAARNPALASAALFEIDALRHAGLDIDDHLLAALADPALGGTAASIIARRKDPALLARVAGTLSSADPVGQSRAVLTLTLANDQYSRSVLRQAMEDDVFVDTHLRREVGKWLQQ